MIILAICVMVVLIHFFSPVDMTPERWRRTRKQILSLPEAEPDRAVPSDMGP